MLLFECLASTHHSLFEFQRMRGNDVYIHDLFLDREIVVRESPMRIGFNRNEIFDVRLIVAEGAYHFTKGFCFHPAEAGKYIKSEIKSYQNVSAQGREGMILRLMKMRYKYEHYRHLKLDYVYSNDKRVRF
jgi:hypothetical protein